MKGRGLGIWLCDICEQEDLSLDSHHTYIKARDNVTWAGNSSAGKVETGGSLELSGSLTGEPLANEELCLKIKVTRPSWGVTWGRPLVFTCTLVQVNPKHVHTHRKPCMGRHTYKHAWEKWWWKAGNFPGIGRTFRLMTAGMSALWDSRCDGSYWTQVSGREGTVKWESPGEELSSQGGREHALGAHPLCSPQEFPAGINGVVCRQKSEVIESVDLVYTGPPPGWGRVKDNRVLKRQQKKSPTIFFELISFHMIKIIDNLVLSKFCVYYKNSIERLLCSLWFSKLG